MSDKHQNEFAAALSQLNAVEPRDLPPTHPDQLLAQAGRGGQMPSAKLPNKFEAKYKKFKIDDDEDVAKLEKIIGHILNDGWLFAREEWIHTKDGTSYVVIKYLVPKAKPKKKAGKPERQKPKQASRK